MRLAQDESLGVRLTVASVGAVLLLIPFALIAALIVGNAAWAHGLDLRVTDALHGFALRHEWWVLLMQLCSLVFHPMVWRVAALGLVIWLIRRGAWPVAWWVAATMTVGGLLGVVLKLLVGRDRPDLLDPVARAAGYAFPSGHALNSALGAAVFLLVLLPLTRDRPRSRAVMWVAAVVVALMTGISRVALGVHWTSDVVAGWLLGVAVVAVTAAAFLARQRRRGAADMVVEGLEPEVAERR
jgi:membrane-associated phospholipid phosphatase